MKNIAAGIPSNNTSPTSTTQPLYCKAEGIAVCGVLSLEAICIVVGNFLTLFVFSVTKELRKRSLFLVINMAFADLMIGALSLPLYIYFYVGDVYQLWNVTIETKWRIFFAVLQVIFSKASLISAAMISFERLCAVLWPLKHRTLSVRAYRIAVSTVWILAVCFSAIANFSYYYISRKLAIWFWISSPFILTIIVGGCNIAIWRSVIARRGRHKKNSRVIKNQRLTNTLLFVSIFPLLTWLPLFIVNYLKQVQNVFMPPKIYYVFVILNCSHFFVNPVVYVLRIPEFRQALCWRYFTRKQPFFEEGRQTRVGLLRLMSQRLSSQAVSDHLATPSCPKLSLEGNVEDAKL